MPESSIGFYRVLSATYIKLCPLVFATLPHIIKLISVVFPWNGFDSLGGGGEGCCWALGFLFGG